MQCNTRIFMVRENLRDIPRYGLPRGYSFRTYRPGDEDVWAAIHQDAEPLIDVDRRTFERNFGYDRDALPERCFFLVDPAGRDVGTGTAWYEESFRDGDYGRVHWICILREWQGRGLAKPLMTHVMDTLARWHDRAYLTTSAGRPPAVNLYLGFGFRPCIQSDEQRRAWEYLAGKLAHPALDEYRAPVQGDLGPSLPD